MLSTDVENLFGILQIEASSRHSHLPAPCSPSKTNQRYHWLSWEHKCLKAADTSNREMGRISQGVWTMAGN